MPNFDGLVCWKRGAPPAKQAEVATENVTSHVSQGTFFGLPLAKRVMKDPSSRPEYSITPFLSVAKPCGNGKGLGNTLDHLDLLRLHEMFRQRSIHVNIQSSTSQVLLF